MIFSLFFNENIYFGASLKSPGDFNKFLLRKKKVVIWITVKPV